MQLKPMNKNFQRASQRKNKLTGMDRIDRIKESTDGVD
jgi:hypothetical protein